MRNKFVLVLAVVFGLLAALLVFNYLNHVNNAAKNQNHTQVVTATQDIPANTKITDAMLILKPFPTELRNNNEVVNVRNAVGKISTVAISKGEVLLEKRLVKPGESSERLSYTIPEGLRAISIPVDEVTGVANMIQKGDRVDVISVVIIDSTTPPRSVVVLQNIEVLAIGTTLNTSSAPNPEKVTPPKTVTLAVNLNDSLRLKMAQQEGGISLLLRSPGDNSFSQAAPFMANQF